MKKRIVFVGAKRTPFGAFGGSFTSLTATDLAVSASEAALTQCAGSKAVVDHVIFGNVMQTASDAAYLSRHVGIRCGLGVATPAVTVNRLCGSGFEAIAEGARLIELSEAKVVLAGGAESMSQSPYVLRGARFGYRMGSQDLEDALMSGLYDPIAKLPMALTAEKLAEEYKISRSQCDEFALRSQRLAQKAATEKWLDNELSPVKLVGKKGEVLVDKDEHIRKDATLEGLSKLKAVFKKDGVVTAGNASGMVDGAAASILTTEEIAKSKGWSILGEWLGSFVVGCDPSIMGIGPVPAIQGLLAKYERKLSDINLIEVNEAFAAQALSVVKALSLNLDLVNTEGGAIAIGHPLGASGTRLTNHLLYSLARRGGGLGVASACIGGGQGIAVLVKV